MKLSIVDIRLDEHGRTVLTDDQLRDLESKSDSGLAAGVDEGGWNWNQQCDGSSNDVCMNAITCRFSNNFICANQGACNFCPEEPC